ncbi:MULTISPECIES: hypothetical protein [Actinosynnema]|uniref:maleate cis-trans isomerase family protein n=1 Tax=Actinosynnema TaxID=40566 RepID=UPI0020A53DEA|nr:hypothetical protein [Actinosynnema pretiosum]MCP2092461.1 maleate isomerase [Actinosynnema pretiosum]
MSADAPWAARLGVLVIHNDPVPEAELARMAPPGVSVHAARFESPTSTGAEYTTETWQHLIAQPDVRRGLVQLGQLGATAICLCFASASFLGEPGFDEGFSAAGTELAGVPVYTAGQAVVEALRRFGVGRPLVVAPPWFTAPTFTATTAYLERAGLPPAGLVQYRLDRDWDSVVAHLAFDRGARWEVDPDEVCRQVADAFPADADSLLMPGSGFRSWGAVERLEQRLGVPVVTGNQACLWRLLDLAGVSATVPGGGTLLAAAS